MTHLKLACSSYPTNLFDFLVETESFSETLPRHSRSNFSQVLREPGPEADDAEIQPLFEGTDRTQAMSKAGNGTEVKGNMDHKTKGKKKDENPGAQAKKRRCATPKGPSELRKALDFNWKPRSRNRRSASKAYAWSYLDRSRVFNRQGNARHLGLLGLTRRETEVLTWITQGKTNYEIGVILNISPRTICKHVQRILNKLKVENRTAAAAIAIGTLADAPRALRGSMRSPGIPGRLAANANHPRPRKADHPSPIIDPSTRAGFTLLELLIVVGIIGLLLVLIAPAFKYIKGGTDVTSAAFTIKGALDTARTYAMANNTFTWVGFKEVDVSQDPSASPQIGTTGRVAIAIVASKDGTRGYDVTNTNLLNPAWTNYNNGANLLAVGKLQYLNNVHLAGALTTAGNMARPNVVSDNYRIGNAPASVTPFDWPVGSALDNGQYSFKKVINFDPQGVARIQYSTNTDTISPYTEVGLQQTHGTTVDVNSPNVVAIQLSGVGGSVTVYRP